MGIRGGMARNTLANANRVLDRLVPEPGAFHVMDRGHVDFERLFPLHRRGAFFVVRAKSNMKFRRRHSAAADKSAGVRCDQTIVPAGIKTRKRYPQPLRRVGYYDAKSNQGISYRNVNNAADCVRGKRRPWGKCKKNESV